LEIYTYPFKYYFVMAVKEKSPGQAGGVVAGDAVSHFEDIEAEASTHIYMMKGEYFPRPSELEKFTPSLKAVDLKASIVKKFGSSLLGLKKTLGKAMSVAAIAGGIRRILSGLK